MFQRKSLTFPIFGHSISVSFRNDSESSSFSATVYLSVFKSIILSFAAYLSLIEWFINFLCKSSHVGLFYSVYRSHFLYTYRSNETIFFKRTRSSKNTGINCRRRWQQKAIKKRENMSLKILSFGSCCQISKQFLLTLTMDPKVSTFSRTEVVV